MTAKGKKKTMSFHPTAGRGASLVQKNTWIRQALRKLIGVTVAGSMIFPPLAAAQTVNLPAIAGGANGDAVAEAMRAFQQRLNGPTQVPSQQPNVTIQTPSVYPSQLSFDAAGNPVSSTAPLNRSQMSSVEQMMSERAGQPVRQFGYQSFGRGGAVITREVGALQDNYILGVGDEIALTLRGHENASYRTQVDRSGRVVFPALPPVAAAGRNFGSFRAEIDAAIARALPGTESLVSIGQIRQISVRVVGEVERPGVYNLTGLSTAVDALDLAGGIRKTGSLRDLQIVRGGRTISLDLYKLLTGNSSGNIVTLTDGDRIVVPLQTRSAAVVGSVKRPAIYELPLGGQASRFSDLLALAGGPEIAGSYRFSVLRTAQDGRRELVQVKANSNEAVHDGDVVFVSPSVDVSDAKVELMGSSRLTGFYPLGATGSLRGLLKSADMFAPTVGKPLPYLLLASVIRLNPQTLQRTVLPFSPVDVLSGKTDMPLQSNDIVYVLNVTEMHYIAQQAISSEQQPSRRLVDDHGGQSRAPDTDSILASAVAGTPQPGASLTSSDTLLAQAQQQNRTDSAALSNQFPNQTNQASLTTTAQPFARQANEQTTASDENMSGRPKTEEERLYPGIIDRLRSDDDEDLEADRNPSEARQSPFTGNNKMSLTDNDRMSLAGDGRMQAADHRRAPARLFVGIDDDARRLLVRVLSGYSVSVAGEVNMPGSFLAMPETGLDRMVEAAGGLTPKADLHAVDITELDIDNTTGVSRTNRKVLNVPKAQFAGLSVMPFDRIRFNPVFSDRDSGDVAVYGQVRSPGTYEILRGEHMSSLLARAGGLTSAAYAPGAIFLRRSVAAQERGVMRREADLLESQIVALAGNTGLTPNSQPSQVEIGFVTQIVQRLRQGSDQNGRIAVRIDPAEITAHAELDIVMEPGDQLFVPRMPSSIIVSGEVMAPGGIQYRAHRSVTDYLAMAGGPTEIADEDHMFVVLPDGSAEQVNQGWLGHLNESKLVPGSVIIVPRRLRNFTWDTVLENVIQTTSQLAITAASISVIFR